MSQEHAHLDATGGKTPSHRVVQDQNAAVFKPAWLVLDDINVELASILTFLSAVVSIFVLHYSWLKVLPIAAAIIVPLRLFLPLSSVPQGRVLITGGSSGIGAELCYIFASKGHDLIIVGRSDEQLNVVKENVMKKFGRTVHTVSIDLSIPGSAKKLYDHVKAQGLQVDVLVNDAALGASGDVMDQPLELVERMTTLNCITLVQLTQLFARDMISHGRGWILQLSSVLGWMGSPGQNIYSATKHFVRSFSEDLSVELRAHPNVVLTQLMPGPVRTQFITRGHAEETFIFALSGTVEEPKDVARAGYDGLCKRRRMVFSSWNAAATAVCMYLLPRSVHLTLARLMMAPVHGVARANMPDQDQRERCESLGKGK